MRLREGLPAHGAPTRWIDSVLREDSLDRAPSDEESEIRKSAPDSRVAPARVVDRHFEDPFLDLAGNARATRAASRAPVVLLSHKLAVPAQQRIRGDDRRALVQPGSSQWLGLSREPATLGIREAKPLSAELFAKRSVLGLQILDHLYPLAGDPADQQVQEELNRERHRNRTLARLQSVEMGRRRRDPRAINRSISRKQFASAEFWNNTRVRICSSACADGERALSVPVIRPR